MGYICLKLLLIIIIIIVIIIINIIIIIMIIIIIIIIIIIKPNFKRAIQCKHVTRAYKNSCTAGPLPRDDDTKCYSKAIHGKVKFKNGTKL